jgi:kinetochore protein Mis13/DSN1
MPDIDAQTLRKKAEKSAWLEVTNTYNSYRTNVLSELDMRHPHLPTSKSKGKRKGKEQERGWSSASLALRDHKLPEAFRGEGGVALARSIVQAREEGRKSPLSERLKGLEFKVCFRF